MVLAIVPGEDFACGTVRTSLNEDFEAAKSFNREAHEALNERNIPVSDTGLAIDIKHHSARVLTSSVLKFTTT